MTLIWLRVALICYAVGLLYALVALTRTSEILSKVALHASYLGMVFHFVSLTEAVVQSRPADLGLGAQLRIAAGLPDHGRLHARLPGLQDDNAGHRGFPAGFSADLRGRHRSAAAGLHLGSR